MRRHLIALPLAAFLATSTALPAFAEENTPESLATEGIARLMQAIELFMESLPLYAAPEILPNGDILIRRIDPDESQDSEAGGQDDSQTDI